MTINRDSELTGDQARASPPLPATTYQQAQASYRGTIDARERFEELTGRELSTRAYAMLKARGTYDPQRHGDADRYQPLTATEHLEILAAGEVLARYYRHPTNSAPRGSGRGVVAPGRRRRRHRRGARPAGVPRVGRRPAPPARRLPGQVRPERRRPCRRHQPRPRTASRAETEPEAGQ